LSGKGGLVWLKGRSSGNHILQDTDRGANNYLMSDSTAATQTLAGTNFVFGSTGFSMDNNYLGWNTTSNPYVSWSFAQQPKFFDVVTYTGDGIARTIAHNLGSVPGCMIVKRVSNTANWFVYHRSAVGLFSDPPDDLKLFLNLTNNASGDVNTWNSTAPTDTVFSVGASTDTNASGETYVAYLFAHNAGGFPISGGGSTNGISCGSFTGGSTVTLGYEPQWILYKVSNDTSAWYITDNMRGFLGVGNADTTYLNPNTTAAEGTSAFAVNATPTGFTTTNLNPAATFIYVAIRRGPMKPPTVGTSVFNP
jgi:hypothetical protein